MHGIRNFFRLIIAGRSAWISPDGFIGGLSAEKYISITKTSRVTATRDLVELSSLKALKKTGQLKSTRYPLLTWEQAIAAGMDAVLIGSFYWAGDLSQKALKHVSPNLIHPF